MTLKYHNRACKREEAPRMALPKSFISQEIADNTINPKTGNPSTTNYRLAGADITAANMVAQEALITTLLESVDALIIGQPQKSVYTLSTVYVSAAPASSPLAQRENKWFCRYHGTTLNQKFSVSIGTADLSLLANNSEFLVLSGGPGAAFKSAFEAYVKSPDDSAEAVVLDSVQFVGRNT